MEHTIFGLIKKRGEIAGPHKVALKAVDALKADLDAIDRALVLCGYEDDPKGRWIDNRMIERLWRALKYECIYLNAFETGSEARAGIGNWIAYYNSERPHSTHGILTPDDAYEKKQNQ